MNKFFEELIKDMAKSLAQEAIVYGANKLSERNRQRNTAAGHSSIDLSNPSSSSPEDVGNIVKDKPKWVVDLHEFQLTSETQVQEAIELLLNRPKWNLDKLANIDAVRLEVVFLNEFKIIRGLTRSSDLIPLSSMASLEDRSRRVLALFIAAKDYANMLHSNLSGITLIEGRGVSNTSIIAFMGANAVKSIN